MKDEKEEIQAISSMLGDRLLKITYDIPTMLLLYIPCSHAVCSAADLLCC